MENPQDMKGHKTTYTCHLVYTEKLNLSYGYTQGKNKKKSIGS